MNRSIPTQSLLETHRPGKGQTVSIAHCIKLNEQRFSIIRQSPSAPYMAWNSIQFISSLNSLAHIPLHLNEYNFLSGNIRSVDVTFLFSLLATWYLV